MYLDLSEASPPPPPPEVVEDASFPAAADDFDSGGTIERDEACRMFGVSSATWSRWQRIGRVPAGRWTRYGSGRTYHKVYPLDELRRLLAELTPAPGSAGTSAVVQINR